MNLRKKFSSQLTVLSLFLGVLVLGMISGSIFQVNKYREYKAEISDINKQIKETKEQVKEIAKTENDKSLEDMARNRLNMVKPGEVIYIDVDGAISK